VLMPAHRLNITPNLATEWLAVLLSITQVRILARRQVIVADSFIVSSVASEKHQDSTLK
jgi:hypothetical protein